MTLTFQFDAAIAAHKKWLEHLEQFADGSGSETIDYDAVGDATRCDMGHWLAGEGRKFCHLHGFGHLEEVHALFHKTALQAVTLIRQGSHLQAHMLIAGRLADLSVEIVQVIEALKRDFHAA